MKNLKGCKVVLFCLFFAFFVFAKEARSEMVSGILEHLLICGDPPVSVYQIDTGKERIPFHPPPNIRPPAGSKMSIEGDWLGGKFFGKEIKSLDDWIPPPNITVGEQRTIVLMSYTPDKPPPGSATRE